MHAKQEKVSDILRSGRVPILILAALKILLAIIKPINSDEPQHLHVVWGWTAGLIQYRDLFDNHTPLFHILMSPLLWLFTQFFGERAEALLYMRIFMLPFLVVMVVYSYLITIASFPKKIADGSIALIFLFPFVFLMTTEFRTDNMWSALWLYGLWRLMTPSRMGRHTWITGLVFGATFAVSMKTVLMAASTAGAFLVVNLFASQGLSFLRARDTWLRLAQFLGGMLIVPGIIVLFYACAGALPSLLYGTIGHNTLASSSAQWAAKFGIFPLLMPIIIWLTHRYYRLSTSPQKKERAILFLILTLYNTIMWSYWPLITNQDYLPIIPLFIPILVAAIDALGIKLSLIIPILLLLETGLILKTLKPLGFHLPKDIKTINAMLALSSNEETVMDAKGETIFRRRPYYYAIEKITFDALHNNKIADNIAESIEAHNVHVIRASNRYTDRTEAFIAANYLRLSPDIFAAGKMLHPSKGDRRIVIVISGEYSIVCRAEPCSLWIDGSAATDSVYLSKGEHSYRLLADSDAALLWSPAHRLGFVPSHEFETDSGGD